MKQYKTTGILFLLVLIILGYTYFFEYKKKLNDQNLKETSQKILPFNLSEIEGVDLSGPKGHVLLKKEEGDWKILSPIQDRASAEGVQEFLSTLLRERYEEVIAEDKSADSSIFGFGNNNNQISFVLSGGKEFSVEIGSVAALSGNRYLKIGGDDRILLSSYTWELSAQKEVESFRDKSLISNKIFINKILIQNPTGNLNFNIKDGKWYLDEIKGEIPDQSEVDDISYQVRGLKALSFADLQAKEVSLLKSLKLIVSVFGDKNEKVTLQFYKKGQNEYYAEVSDRIGYFKVLEEGLEPFKRDKEYFRDRKIPLRFDILQVEKVQYRSDIVSYDLIKKGNDWVLEKEEGNKEASSIHVNELLVRLSEMKVTNFFDKDISFQKSGMSELKLMDKENNNLLDLKWSLKVIPNSQGETVIPATSQLWETPFGLDEKDLYMLPFNKILIKRNPNKSE